MSLRLIAVRLFCSRVDICPRVEFTARGHRKSHIYHRGLDTETISTLVHRLWHSTASRLTSSRILRQFLFSKTRRRREERDPRTLTLIVFPSAPLLPSTVHRESRRQLYHHPERILSANYSRSADSPPFKNIQIAFCSARRRKNGRLMPTCCRELKFR